MPAAVPLGQRPLPHQPGQDLLDQERDALGPPGDEFVHRGRQVGGVQAGPGHVGHRRRVEAAQRQHGGGPAGRERAGERGRFAAFLPEGGETQHPFGGQVVGEVLQQRQRLLVGPVQVLQHEHAAGLRSQDAQQAQDRLAEEDRRLLPRHRLRWPPLGNQPPQHRPERAEFLAGRQAPRSPGRGQRLGERPERRGRAAGHGPAGQDGQAALARRAHDLPDQPRLADAGLSGQEHRAAASRPGRGQGGPQPAGFLVPPDQDRAQHLRHRISIGPEAGAGLKKQSAVAVCRLGPCGLSSGFTGRVARLRRLRCLVHKFIVRRSAAETTWWIRAMWLIWCTIDPRINRIARINHVIFTIIVLVDELWCRRGWRD